MRRARWNGAGVSPRIAEPIDLVLETCGIYLLSDSDAAVKPSNEALGGIKLFVDKSSHLLIGAGPRYTSGFEAADLRAVLGFVFEPPALDTDRRAARLREGDRARHRTGASALSASAPRPLPSP